MALEFNDISNIQTTLATEITNFRMGSDMNKELHWKQDIQEVTVTFAKTVEARNLPSQGVPSFFMPQRSAYKASSDIAVVTITPRNKDLKQAISASFLEQKIPASMGMPARLYFDAVTINGKGIISSGQPV